MDAPATARAIRGDSPNRETSDQLAMVSVNVTQGPTDRQARGTVWVGTPSDHAIEVREFGVIQTGSDWASVTGRGAVRGQGEQTITVTLDGEFLFLTTDSGMRLKYPFRRRS
jgi:hypothetical protein